MFASPGSFVFTLDSGTIPDDTPVHWVNGTTASYDGVKDSSTPFSGVTYNIEFTSSGVGSGGGDVHVNPVYNPTNKIYILPTNNKIYKYFDNRDEHQRIIVNCKMWVLDNRFIYIVDNLQKMNSSYFEEAKGNIVNYIIKDNFSKIDTSFIKYVSFIVKTKDSTDVIVFDTETLSPIDLDKSIFENNNFDTTNKKINNYNLDLAKNDNYVKKLNMKYIQVSEIMPYKKEIFSDWKLFTKIQL